MSSFKTALFVACAVLVSACGFQPLYGERGAVAGSYTQGALEAVEVSNIQDAPGQELRNLLVDKINTTSRAGTPRYLLVLTPVKEKHQSMIVQKDASSTRGQIRLDTSFSLIDISTKQVLFKDSVRTVNGYDILDNQFTNIVSKNDARKRSLQGLSEQILLKLALYLNRT